MVSDFHVFVLWQVRNEEEHLENMIIQTVTVELILDF